MPRGRSIGLGRQPAMYKERKIERHQLQDYLQVFNCHTGKLVGCLGNVSGDGLMLISSLPVLVGARFDLCLKLPNGNVGQPIDVSAKCLWCHEDETPGSYDSGFELCQVSTEYLEFVQLLRRYFCFYPSYEASA
ncbi:Uncharacterized protein ALO75_00951 [Pseudomonas syringae pv. coryli]|uniref:PilZ domain-containing protein n=2 Tax=Pseudomonas TaxID=286 RepID=A0A0P9P7Y5_9PSED|nr:Uncharacterized protein ALO75_00951 [Pseudomonas syringae pv. coryli]